MLSRPALRGYKTFAGAKVQQKNDICKKKVIFLSHAMRRNTKKSGADAPWRECTTPALRPKRAGEALARDARANTWRSREKRRDGSKGKIMNICHVWAHIVARGWDIKRSERAFICDLSAWRFSIEGVSNFKKMRKNAKKWSKLLRMSKKSSNFALAFSEQQKNWKLNTEN